MSFMDSPRREPVPPFGAWKYEDPRSPVIDYTVAFNRARASRLGCVPQEHNDEDEYFSQSDDSQSASTYAPETRVIVADGADSVELDVKPEFSHVFSCPIQSRRHLRRKPFFQFLVCGAKDQAVA